MTELQKAIDNGVIAKSGIEHSSLVTFVNIRPINDSECSVMCVGRVITCLRLKKISAIPGIFVLAENLHFYD